MSKFSRLASAAPGAQAPYPSQPASSLYPQQAPSPYNQPPVPPRPGASPQPYQQPSWQSPQQQQQYGQQQLGVPQQGGYQSPQPQSAYTSYQSQYQPPNQSGQSQYQQPPYQQPPSGGYGYGAPPGQGQGQSPYPGGPQGGPSGGAPQQYGGQPPFGGAGAPQAAPVGNAGAYKQLLQATIQEKQLQNFYPPGHPMLDQIAARAAQQVSQLAATWRISPEIASDIVKLALYDVILYIDDSGSMQFEENGERIDDLKLILSRVAYATSLFDEDGIQVRFMNSPDQGNNIRSEQQVTEMISRTRFSGLTPMGRELDNKILRPLVLQNARNGTLRKPVLVITITDGQPTGESSGDVARIIKNASDELARNPRYGKGALAFQFAQVGNDLKAREFLSKLDEEPTIGDIIDCTSNYEVEADEMSRANPPVNLSPELWLIKLLLGSIDSSYDTKDEKSSAPRPPQGGYGGPPPTQGGYGGGYPPQGGYGGPPPQQGGYGQQGPGGYGQQQGGYGRPPPQQGGYPSQQQGGYGAPPPPPRY
ncbi:hypothetical protein PV05_00150 [Exophiala xenobiotica]|uniref:VWFA domain-containing protein n=2 Tax=Exophiala xenobiotica TaxID=348802 RepID=A0A0D2C4S2_9EURO|nr:uncharacterized protein PV05_00150 [Exophiala xenobiotica]KIW59886.1 hypothetical protein PV05_00150 [Exophiala xenobiotica]